MFATSKYTPSTTLPRAKSVYNTQAKGYRYRFNGQENDKETYGDGNALDFGARIYDSRLGRFISIDPKYFQYLSISPYCFAANSPIKLIDVNGEGPGDRVSAARKMIGIGYSQNHKEDINDPFSSKAVGQMDCSELVSRVLFADGVIPKMQLLDSKSIKDLLSNKSKFEQSNIPQVGDIAIWEGHVAIVTKVGENGTFSVVMARGEDKNSYEQTTPISAKKYRDSKFYGFYRPKKENETPDGDGFNNPLTGETGGNPSKNINQKSLNKKSNNAGLFDQLIKTNSRILEVIDGYTQDEPYDLSEQEMGIE